MLLGLNIQHKVDKGSFKPGPQAHVQGKACPGDLGSPLKIKNAELFSNLPVGKWLKAKQRGFTNFAHKEVVFSVFTFRDRWVRQVGKLHQNRPQCLLLLVQLLVQGLYFLGNALHFSDQVRGVLLIPFHLRNTLRDCIARMLQAFNIEENGPAL